MPAQIDTGQTGSEEPEGARPAGAQPAPIVSGAATVTLDASATTRCRRRIHLDHDPAAVGAPRALPDPALAQRRSDAAEHRVAIGTLLAAAGGPAWHSIAGESAAERVAATSAAVAAGASFVWSAVIPDDRTTGPGRRGGAELLVRLTGGGYVPVIVVRHRVSDRGSGALTTPLPVTDPRQAAVDPARKPRSQPRDLLRLAHLHRMLAAAGWGPGPQEQHRHHGGVIGLDADVVVWHDLAAGQWPGGHSTLSWSASRT
ncbi:MAG: putative RecB family nuclease [Pseudonocardia sp.]|nr:putative RecB family nuclease [Pseudonocardia sp.]